MRLGILGSGLRGGKLGTLFARAGHELVFGYARSKDKLENPRGTPMRTRGRERRVRRRGERTSSCWPCTGPESKTC